MRETGDHAMCADGVDGPSHDGLILLKDQQPGVGVLRHGVCLSTRLMSTIGMMVPRRLMTPRTYGASSERGRPSENG